MDKHKGNLGKRALRDVRAEVILPLASHTGTLPVSSILPIPSDGRRSVVYATMFELGLSLWLSLWFLKTSGRQQKLLLGTLHECLRNFAYIVITLNAVTMLSIRP